MNFNECDLRVSSPVRNYSLLHTLSSSSFSPSCFSRYLSSPLIPPSYPSAFSSLDSLQSLLPSRNFLLHLLLQLTPIPSLYFPFPFPIPIPIPFPFPSPFLFPFLFPFPPLPLRQNKARCPQDIVPSDDRRLIPSISPPISQISQSLSTSQLVRPSVRRLFSPFACARVNACESDPESENGERCRRLLQTPTGESSECNNFPKFCHSLDWNQQGEGTGIGDRGI